jgi:dTDP-4-amino-4,6-dideoxygalactose transaminase
MNASSKMNLNVPIVRLDRQYAALQSEFETAALRVMRSGHYILGPHVQALESEMARRTQSAYGVGVANGTDSLYLALRALDIGLGDEVITTPMSYIATSEAIVRAGATPIFVDIVADATYLMDLDAVEAAITPRTKAIIPVHLFGLPVDMTTLMALAKANDLAVIEDCAQAVDATWQGKPVGGWGDFGSFSFFPTKNLGAFGDGGLLTTQTAEHAERLRALRVHGQTSTYDHAHEGMNSRLDELQAALVQVKLPYLKAWGEARREKAQRYTQAFSSVEALILPIIPEGAEHVFHQYTMALRPSLRSNASLNRDDLVAQLQAAGVGARVYYPIPLHLQGMHRNLGYQAGQFPHAEEACQTVLSLPIFPEMTEDEQCYVIETLQRFLR